MQEYFNQYVEEYYEDVDEQPRSETTPSYFRDEQTLRLDSLDDIFSFLKNEKIGDIAVLDLGRDGPGMTDIIIIGSPFNVRHGLAVSEKLRKASQFEDTPVTKRSVRNNFGWFQVSIGRIQVNLIGDEARKRFDLESLWSGADPAPEVEDIPSIPPPRSKS